MTDEAPKRLAKLFIEKYVVNCDGVGCPRHAVHQIVDVRGRKLSKLCDKCLAETIGSMEGDAEFLWQDTSIR
jgi:hypothetical protein